MEYLENVLDNILDCLLRYNKRQLSRIYPRGSRVDSSNYMPQVREVVVYFCMTNVVIMFLRWIKFLGCKTIGVAFLRCFFKKLRENKISSKPNHEVYFLVKQFQTRHICYCIYPNSFKFIKFARFYHGHGLF